MEIEFIETEPDKPKLNWRQLENGEWFVFDQPYHCKVYGLCRRHFDASYGAVYQSETGNSYTGNVDKPITRVRIHKIVCEKVVEQ